MDGATDAEVRAAAADVLERVDVRVARMRVRGEERDRRHDLAGLAEAALRDVLVDPRLLHRVQRVAFGEPLDCRDFATGAVAQRSDARVEGGAVEVARARLAHTDPAAV